MEQMLRVSIIGDTSKLNKALSQSSARLKNFGAKLTGIGANLSAKVTLPLALAGGAAIKFASDLDESLNKVDVSFKDSAQVVRDFAKTTLKSFGIAEGTALDMAAMFGDMSTSMGLTTSEAAKMSTELVSLAGDLASFKNINIDEVTTALSGVFTGETESLKRLGVVMTEVNLKQFALNKGIKTQLKDMTQAEKVALRFQYVMSVTANAQGDFARTSESAANQTRQFTEGLKQLGANIGKELIPAFTKVVKNANGILDTLQNLDPSTKNIIIRFGLLGAAIPPLILALGSVSSALGAINPLVLGITASLTALGYVIANVTELDTLTNQINKAKDAQKKLRQELDIIRKSKPFLEGDVEALKEFSEKQIELNKAVIAYGEAQIKADPSGTVAAQKIFGAAIEDAKNKIIVYEASLKSLNQQIAQTKTLTGDLNLDDFVFTEPKTVENVDNLASSLGDLFDTSEVLKGADSALEKFDPDNVPVFFEDVDVADDMEDSLNPIHQKAQELEDRFKMVSEGIKGGLIGAFDAFGAALASGGNPLAALAKSILASIGGILQQLGAAAVAASKLAKSFAVPGVGMVAGLAAIALGAVIKGIASQVQNKGVPSFANGGIVSAPTLAMVGDNFGASRGNPEVISPLNKLQSMIGGRDVNVSGQFRLEGQDLVVALQRANRNRSRLI